MTAIPHPSTGAIADASASTHDHAVHHELSFFKKYIFSTDHKVIGLQFLFLGLSFMVIGGLEAMLIRWQLAWPNKAVPLLSQYMADTGVWNRAADGTLPGMPPEFYNAAFTMHASLMIFFVIIPLLVGTFGNYLIPLKIGAPDMAFPFLNGFAFWSAVPAGAIMTAGFFLTAPIAGWTSYPPLSAIALHQGMVPLIEPTNGFVTFMSYLQIHGVAPDGSPLMSAWTPIPLLLNTLALFL